MIQEFPYDLEKQIEVQAIEEPKQVWIDSNRIIVYTGGDINQPAISTEI